MNPDLINRIADYIEQDAHRYNQAAWFESELRFPIDTILEKLPEDQRLAWEQDFAIEVPPSAADHWCETHACIAGNAAILAGYVTLRITDSPYSSVPRINMVLADDVIVDDEPGQRSGFAGTSADGYAYMLGRRAMGIDDWVANVLFDSNWIPAGDMTAADALRSLAAGASIIDVTNFRQLSYRQQYIARYMQSEGRVLDYMQLRFLGSDQLYEVFSRFWGAEFTHAISRKFFDTTPEDAMHDGLDDEDDEGDYEDES